MGLCLDQMVSISGQQLELLKDTGFLLEKRRISQSIIKLLGTTENQLKETINQAEFEFPNGTLITAGKISKGENYQGLPYFVLDFPRLFQKNHVFAYRIMVWWGHEISFTLHLEGAILDLYYEKIRTGIKRMSDYYLCANTATPWDYHFGTDNYQKISDISDYQIDELLKMKHFKISQKCSLDVIAQIDQIAQKYLLSYLDLLT